MSRERGRPIQIGRLRAEREGKLNWQDEDVQFQGLEYVSLQRNIEGTFHLHIVICRRRFVCDWVRLVFCKVCIK
jgi:hypothetical protein